jgi:DNA polymerase V
MRLARARVKRWTGLPVSIGIAPTKTLAKLAAERAKKDARFGGVVYLDTPDAIQAARAATPVGDVWGIGRRWSKRFEAMGVASAEDFARLDEPWVRARMGVVGARTQLELLGSACFDLQTQPQPRQSCVASRSFAHPVTHLDDLKSAVATFAARASERLRTGGLVAGQVSVFVLTDRFKEAAPTDNGSAMVALAQPSNLTADITRAALAALERAYRPGVAYKKAGVMLLDLVLESEVQPNLFAFNAGDAGDRGKAERLQRALDALNGSGYGAGDVVRFGAAGCRNKTERGWSLRRDHRSPRYTTQWAELPVVR